VEALEATTSGREELRRDKAVPGRGVDESGLPCGYTRSCTWKRTGFGFESATGRESSSCRAFQRTSVWTEPKE
jgi:hypothetical protein